MKNRHAALAAVFVVLAATVAYFLLRTPEQASDLSRFDAAPDVQAVEGDNALGDVDLADGGGGTGAFEPDVAIVAETSASTRVALDGRLDGRRWSDLLFAVDDTTGAPITGAFVIHVTGEGGRTVRELASLVEDGDLDEFTLAALDTDRHCPRAFFPAQFAGATNGPVHVRLQRSAAVRVEVEGEVPDTLKDFTLTIAGDVDAPGFDSDGDRNQSMSFAPTLAKILVEDGSERTRGQRVRYAVRTSGVHALFDLDPGPLATWRSTEATLAPASLPKVIGDLPSGKAVSLFAQCPASVELFDAAGDALQPDESGRYVLSAETPIELTVRFRGEASVVGRVPAGAVDLFVESVPGAWERGRPQIDEDGGAFVLTGLRPGTQYFSASWTDDIGKQQRAQRRLVLEPGETTDVGLLVPDPKSTISFAPVLVVGGAVDLSRLDGLMEPTRWSIVLFPAAAARPAGWRRFDAWQQDGDDFLKSVLEGTERIDKYGARFTSSSDTLDHISVEGMPYGTYAVVPRDIVLPPVVAEQYRFVRWEFPRSIEVTGDAAHELRLILEPAASCTVTVPVPPCDANVAQSIHAVAWNTETGEVLDTRSAGFPLRSGSPPFMGPQDGSKTSLRRVMLDRGQWTIVTVVVAGFFDSSSPGSARALDPSRLTSHVGQVEVLVEDVEPISITVPLTHGASVRGGSAGFGVDPDDWDGRVQLVPIDAPSELAELWTGSQGDDQGRVTVRGLLPDTEYHVDGTDHIIRTGAAGSLTEL